MVGIFEGAKGKECESDKIDRWQRWEEVGWRRGVVACEVEFGGGRE